MSMIHRFTAWLLVLAITPFSLCLHADTLYSIQPGGYLLRNLFDASYVEDNWLPNACVTWQTGALVSRDQRTCDKLGLITLSHCSAFVAAVINYQLGYDFLTPDNYSYYTSNWQANWLENSGVENGWTPLTAKTRKEIYINAQIKANAGCLVVASYKNPNWKPGANAEGLAGHIAMIRPSARYESTLASKGPQETQAGMANYNSAAMIIGFGSYELARAKFYWHASPYCQG
ncbi:MAG: hypothetical protein K5Q00_03235 [Gammaproteobacteria bacterium]|nr:hypothetical protein [Gammaproteobacteria bacterium]